MNILSKFFKRSCRSLAKIVFPSSLRVFFLRLAGVNIGKEVAINEGFTLACNVGHESYLLIEDRVAVGPEVIFILTSDPNYSRLNDFKRLYPFINIKGKIQLKHDSWIGAGAIILPNVTVGEFSVVGAGSVVTKDVPPYTVVAGVPARTTKHLDIKIREDLISNY
jgi:Acetyltransferase (isoleucine patch superfamily)